MRVLGVELLQSAALDSLNSTYFPLVFIPNLHDGAPDRELPLALTFIFIFSELISPLTEGGIYLYHASFHSWALTQPSALLNVLFPLIWQFCGFCNRILLASIIIINYTNLPCVPLVG